MASFYHLGFNSKPLGFFNTIYPIVRTVLLQSEASKLWFNLGDPGSLKSWVHFKYRVAVNNFSVFNVATQVSSHNNVDKCCRVARFSITFNVAKNWTCISMVLIYIVCELAHALLQREWEGRYKGEIPYDASRSLEVLWLFHLVWLS